MTQWNDTLWQAETSPTVMLEALADELTEAEFATIEADVEAAIHEIIADDIASYCCYDYVVTSLKAGCAHCGPTNLGAWADEWSGGGTASAAPDTAGFGFAKITDRAIDEGVAYLDYVQSTITLKELCKVIRRGTTEVKDAAHCNIVRTYVPTWVW